MKHKIAVLSLSLSALVAAPSLVAAQGQTAPVQLAKAPPLPMPKAQELLNDLIAPYAAAKTFSGKLNISAENASLKTQLGFSEMQIRNSLPLQLQRRFAER